MVLSKKALTAQILGYHRIAAMMTGLGELVISEEEAALLADAVLGLAPYYNITLAPKLMAHLNLLMAVTMIYGPRVQIIMAKNKHSQAEKMTPLRTA